MLLIIGLQGRKRLDGGEIRDSRIWQRCRRMQQRIPEAFFFHVPKNSRSEKFVGLSFLREEGLEMGFGDSLELEFA